MPESVELSDDLEEKFTNIATRAIEAAERIDCSMEEFLAGLDLIKATIEERREMG